MAPFPPSLFLSLSLSPRQSALPTRRNLRRRMVESARSSSRISSVPAEPAGPAFAMPALAAAA
eukprot:5842554-Alexandrium_andersonii.AAC.1